MERWPVEDQQPAAGDLADEIADDEAADTTTVEDVSAEDAENTDSAVEDDDADVDQSWDPPVGPPLAEPRKRRPLRVLAVVAATLAAVSFVGAAAFAGAEVQPYLTDRATVATKQRVAEAAYRAITALWSYTPENVDKLADRASQYLSGDFVADYRKYVETLIIAPNKQAQITSKTDVVAVAVESLNVPEATALVYTNTSSASAAHKDLPTLRNLSYRISLRRQGGRWLVTKMTTVTVFNLTPQL
jgi:Mce-associated membrane protein